MHVSAAPRRILTRNRVPTTLCGFQVCDFGLARGLSERMAVDRELVTLWYRAPELLMGDSTYSPKAPAPPRARASHPVCICARRAAPVRKSARAMIFKGVRRRTAAYNLIKAKIPAAGRRCLGPSLRKQVAPWRRVVIAWGAPAYGARRPLRRGPAR